jgi:excisionase family DNA binding protein
MGERYLLVSAVARRLNCDKRVVYGMIQNGKIKAIRVGKRGLRILESTFQDYLKTNEIEPNDFDNA